MGERITSREVYCTFLKVKAIVNDRPFTIPKKPFDEFIKTKPKLVQNNLKIITKRFNTVWININPELYFECGFKLFGKNFWFNKFLDPSIVSLYIKHIKYTNISEDAIKDKTKTGLIWIRKFMIENKLSGIEEYFTYKNGYMNVFISHYLQGRINDIILGFVWMKNKNWINHIDSDIGDMHLGQFIKKRYKIINYLANNNEMYMLLEKGFEVLGDRK